MARIYDRLETEREGVAFFVDNLSLSNLQMRREDVLVELPAARTARDEASSGKTSESDSRLCGLKASRISAKFEQLRWRFKQQHFPFLEGKGSADVHVSDASVCLEFTAMRRERPECAGEFSPALALTRCEVEICDLDLKMEQSRFSFAFNSLAPLFKEQIRLYVQTALAGLIVSTQ